MIQIIRQMIRSNISMIAGTFAFIILCSFIDQSLKTQLLQGSTFIVPLILLAFGIWKPFYSQNAIWLRRLPLRNFQRVSLLATEFGLFTTSAIVAAALGLGLYVGRTGKGLQMSFAEIFNDGNLFGVNFPLIIILIFLATPLTYIFIPSNGQKTYPRTFSRREKIISSFTILAFFVLVYNFSVLFYSAFAIGVLSQLGRVSLLSIWGNQQLLLIRRALTLLPVLAGIALIVYLTEFLPSPLIRPLRRIQVYGAAAPQPTRAWIQNQMLLEGQTQESLRSLSGYGRRPARSDSTLSVSEIQDWSKRAKDSAVFLHGLAIFNNHVWSEAALNHLENDLQTRCAHNGQPKHSRYQTHWDCSIEFIHANRVIISVANLEVFKSYLDDKHPFITSLILEFMLRRGFPKEWQKSIEKLTESDDSLISSYANELLDLQNRNQSYKWFCDSAYSPERADKCGETRLYVKRPFSFATKEPTDSPGSLQLELASTDQI
jgi:hypothetical protein